MLQAELANGPLTVSDESKGQGDLVVRRAWIPYFNIQYYLGLDGISLSLVVLTGLVSVLACLASWNIDKQVKGYFALFLLLVASMMGVFLSLDLFLFYVFFEVMLLPMYFLIAIWGGRQPGVRGDQVPALHALRLGLHPGRVLILYFWPGDAPPERQRDRQARLHGPLVRHRRADARSPPRPSYYGRAIQSWVFILFFIGFIVKLPSFPFHTWLPDAHVEAPTPISMILAGILLKIGGYGLIRLAWPLAPAGAYDWSYLRGRARGLQHPLRGPRGDGPDRLQEAGGLQLGQPHGLRHPGHGRDEPGDRAPSTTPTASTAPCS